mgnify:CR=1 FL=1
MKGTSAEVPFLLQSNRIFVAARPCSDIALRTAICYPFEQQRISPHNSTIVTKMFHVKHFTVFPDS